MTKQNWTKKQEEKLCEVYSKKSIKEIMKLPTFKKFTYAAISNKAKLLGLNGPRRRKSGKHYNTLWSPKEVLWLKNFWGKEPKKELMESFEDAFEFRRTWPSISGKAERLGLGPRFEALVKKGDVKKLHDELPIESLLYLLTKSKRPLNSEILAERIETRCGESISNGEIRNLCKRLGGKGYDIKRIPSEGKIKYVMVRTADISSESYYRPLGNISSEVVFASDFHMGSTNFSEQAWEAFIDDIEEHSVADITISGDLIQCLGVHKLEVPDVALWEIDDQVDMLVAHLQQIPKDVNIHMVIGNHEEKLKHKIQVGYDALAHAVTKMNEAGFNNCNYYGAVAKLIMDDEYKFLMMHSAGGITYATSYRVERVFNTLIERPDIFQVGHTHQLMHLAKAPKYELFIAGCMQRENSWLMNKGITSMVGWYGLRGYSPEKTNFRRVTPRVF